MGTTEIPHGPCAAFVAESGQRYAAYQLTHPEALTLSSTGESIDQPIGCRGGACRIAGGALLGDRTVELSSRGATMGGLNVIQFVTLDGVMQGFHNLDERDGFRHSGWGIPYQNPAQAERASRRLPATGAYLFGRRTYEELSGFWPSQPDENPMAAHLNRSPKYVVTHRDDDLAWSNSHRLEGELIEGVERVKAKTDGNIAVLGSGDVVRQLLAADLVDGFHLYVHPLVLGRGHTLFPSTDHPLRLRLDEVDRTSTGVVELSYTTLR